MFINKKFIFRYLLNPHEIFKNFLFWIKAKKSQKKFIFIIGAPRSGTTLLQRLIITNPLISGFDYETSVFSPKSIYDYSRFKDFICYEKFKECIDGSNDIVTFFEQLHSDFIADSKVKFVLEKTPQHIKRLKFIIDHFPNSKIIHIYRDGRDCFVSGKRGGNIPQTKKIVNYAKYWKKCINSRCEIDSKNIFDISYESLVKNPKENMFSIFNFLNLDFFDYQLNANNYSSDNRADLHEFKRLNSEINDSSVNQFKKFMSEYEINKFQKLCKNELKKLGYELI